jgi:hypothetical protein
MLNNQDSSLNTKYLFNLPMSCGRVGSMDHPVWWDEEMVVVDRTECTHAIRSH